MASFFSILKKVGSVAFGVERVAAPVASTVFPQFAPAIAQLDGWVNRLHSAILTLESENPVDGQGQIKAAAVIADFEAGLDITNAVLALRGKTLVYDKKELEAAISDFVSAYNHLAKLKASFHEADLPKN